MYKRLLVALDGSAIAESILPYALGISQATRSQLTLVRVVDDDGQRAEAARYVDALAARLDAESRCISADGDVATALFQEAARVPGTLVAMTTHGRSGVLGALLGSIAMKVLRGMHEPGIAVPTARDGHRRPQRTGQLHEDRAAAGRHGRSQCDRRASRRTGTRAGCPTGRDLGTRSRGLAASGAATGDLLESSYVHGRAAELGRRHGVEFSWKCCMGTNRRRRLPTSPSRTATPCSRWSRVPTRPR